jgi:PAS domain S-box-containing protein
MKRGIQSLVVRHVARRELADISPDAARLLAGLPIAAAVRLIDEPSTAVFVNEHFVRLFGYTRAEIPSWSAWAALADLEAEDRSPMPASPDEPEDVAGAGAAGVEPMDRRVRCKDGSFRDVLVNASVSDGRLILTFCDVTTRRRAERDVAKARDLERSRGAAHRRELEQKLRVSMAAAAAAHEIQQPLTTILLETQRALERMQTGSAESDELRGSLERMLAESRHAVDMIGRMKALLRTVHSEQRPVAVAEVVSGALLYSKSLLADHGVRVHSRPIGEAAGLVGDGPQLQLALVNLIRNAAEAMAGQPAGTRELAVEVTAAPGSIVLRVGDSGPGMPPEQIERLPFATTKPDGSGLGLYLARACAENHGGTIEVGRSWLGGAEVRLRLPAEREGS